MRYIARFGIGMVLGALTIGCSGCRSDRPHALDPPGTVEQQRLDSTIFDRYPDAESGPTVVGGRPREFQQPLSEPDRSRLFKSRWIPF